MDQASLWGDTCSCWPAGLDLVLGWGALGSCGGAAVAEESRQPILFSHRRWLIVEIQH